MAFDIAGFSHIGFVGPSVEGFFNTFGRALGIEHFHVSESGAPGGFQMHGNIIEGMTRARTSFAKVGGTCLELIQPVENEIIHKYQLDRIGPSVHHIAFWVNDLEKQVGKLDDMGWDLVYSPISLHPGLRERSVSAMSTKETGWAHDVEYPPFFGFVEPKNNEMHFALELIDVAFAADYRNAYGDDTFYPGDLPV